MRIKSALSIVLILTSLSVLVSGVLTMINGDVDHSVLGGTVSIIVGVSSIMTVTGGNIRPRPGKALPLLANIVCIVCHGVALSVKIPGEPYLGYIGIISAIGLFLVVNLDYGEETTSRQERSIRR